MFKINYFCSTCWAITSKWSHKSHVYNYPFLQYMLSNNIQVMAIPAHCSHTVQPQDNVPFECFKRYWEKHYYTRNFQHLGALLTNTNFFTVFNRASIYLCTQWWINHFYFLITEYCFVWFHCFLNCWWCWFNHSNTFILTYRFLNISWFCFLKNSIDSNNGHS